MADEIQLRLSLRVKKDDLDRPVQYGFNADMEGEGAPAPGGFSVPTTGKVVDLSQVAVPGMCAFQNLDDAAYVTLGVYDGARFFPLLEFLPGEGYVFRLSRYLNQEFVGTGTGTNADVNQLMVVATGGAAQVDAQVFEK